MAGHPHHAAGVERSASLSRALQRALHWVTPNSAVGSLDFRIGADDGVRLTLDGRVLAESLVPDRPNPIRASAVLGAGDHPIRIDYFQNGDGSILEFFWRPPSEEETPVPTSALIPRE
jgi:hypothetical protein